MPSKVTKIPPRKQYAVWWARSAEPDKWGRFSYSAPVEIRCRWDRVSQEYRHPKGQTEISSSIVYPDANGYDMGIGDMLREGEMASDEPEDPTTIENTFEIQRIDVIPDFPIKRDLIQVYL